MPMFLFFFFNDTATTEIYTLSLHDALPICRGVPRQLLRSRCVRALERQAPADRNGRSEEHTSELQSRLHLVCRLLLEKKKKKNDSRPGVRPAHATTTQAPEAVTPRRPTGTN